LTSTRRRRAPSSQIAVSARHVARKHNKIPTVLAKLCPPNLLHDMQVNRQVWPPMIALSLALVATACGSSDHGATGRSSPTTGLTVTVVYTATSRSTPSDRATITYTDPTDGDEVPIAGPAIWDYTWHLRAGKPALLRLQVVGPFSSGNSCGISVNGQRVTGASGQGGEAPHTPVVCEYTMSASP
jgi:hypothetical protein